MNDKPFPRLEFRGLSYDQRTNKWTFYCVCKHSFDPQTTMSAVQGITCPKCAREFIVNYNEQTIKEYS